MATLLSKSLYWMETKGWRVVTLWRDAGAAMVRRGPWRSTRTTRLVAAMAPSVSLAAALIVWLPPAREIFALNSLPDSAAATPLTLTLATPLSSLTRPLTSTELPTTASAAGLSMAIVGGWLGWGWASTTIWPASVGLVGS